MKIVKKCAKIICKELNKNHEDKKYFFQVVSDNFEIKDKV